MQRTTHPLVTSRDDDLVFMDEAAEEPVSPASAAGVWRVMIVDDDADVHTATEFALGNLVMQNRLLEFLHAYSAAEARTLLARENDIAVILLDVVMEHEDAGLQLVRHIRETLKLDKTRIILRTGQPGYAPELDAIRDFDINDYKTKSELTRIKLYTTVTTAIRSYEQLCALDKSRRGLDHVVKASAELMSMSDLQSFTAGTIARLNALLNADLDGIACVRHTGELASEWVAIAGSGCYAPLLNKPVRDDDMIRALEQARQLGRHAHTNDSVTLFFGNSTAHDLVIRLNLEEPLSNILQQLLEVFSSNIAAGLDNIELVSRLQSLAFHDPLTRLPNRTLIKERLQETLSGKDKNESTLALVDIDHFSETNDALGHQFGDLLLLSVTARLQSRLGSGLTIGRVGSDTFAVLGHSDRVEPAALLQLFEKPFDINGHLVQLAATVGLVRLCEHEEHASDALKDADIALKRAKLQQRAGYFYFSRSMGDDIRERVRMLHALRTAFDNKELFLAYQPQIDLGTRRAIGAEALLRWKTPEGNFISPDRFIPIAEFSGLIINMGEWVMHEACKELARLHTMGFTDFSISINVSQVQFRHPRFLDTLRNILRDTQVPPTSVELEITESIAMEDPSAMVSLLEQIKATGVTIAIDDFGTGFSSLSYLQRLHADKLKIDRAFITTISDSPSGASIAEMVVHLGRRLGMTVIAEGVEDESQAATLAAFGCPLAQGYLFAKPMPAEQLTQWLHTRSQT
jgi:diguanylate cyclase (GGDEF)-like protein